MKTKFFILSSLFCALIVSVSVSADDTISAVDPAPVNSNEESTVVVEPNPSKEAVDHVILLINAIGTIKNDDTSKNKINAARTAYNELTEEQNSLVSNYKILSEAEIKYEKLKDQKKKSDLDRQAADNVIKIINKIGKVELDKNSEERIGLARTEYNNLSKDQKKLVSNYSTLENAEKLYGTLKSNDTKEKDRAAAERAINAINAIGDVEYTGECLQKINYANEVYSCLSNEQKQFVTNYNTLTAANGRYQKLKDESIRQFAELRKQMQEQVEKKERLRKIVRNTSFGVISIVAAVVIFLVIRRKKKNMDNEIIVSKEEKIRDIVVLSPTNPSPSSNGRSDIDGENGRPIPPTDADIPSSLVVHGAKWVVVGASVKGNGHIQSNMPCQDNNMFESLGNGWGIAIVSDGAGSAAHSEYGSKVVVARGIFHFKNLIEKEGWVEKKVLPTDIEWFQKSYAVLKDLRNDVLMVAKKNNTDVKSLSATCLVVIYSPFGLLTVHIGDGRMGYKSMSGEWKSMMTPHKGDEANQTIFLVSDFWSIPNYEMSGVLVPESRVIRENVKAFALMSDGCENTAWLCSALNSETGKYSDRNLPFDGFFNPLEETLLTFDKENVPEEERQSKWYKFIESGTSGFAKEQDDKTMIYALNVDLVK